MTLHKAGFLVLIACVTLYILRLPLAVDFGYFNLSIERSLSVLLLFFVLFSKIAANQALVVDRKLLLLAFIFSSVIIYPIFQYIWVLDKGAWLKSFLLTLSNIALMALILSIAKHGSRVVTLYSCILTSGFLLALWSAIEVRYGIRFANSDYAVQSSPIFSGIPTATYSNPNNLATVMSGIFSMTIPFIAERSGKLKRMSMVLLAALTIWVVYATWSRANMLACLVAVLGYLLLNSLRMLLVSRVRYKDISFFVLVSSLFLGLIYLLFDKISTVYGQVISAEGSASIRMHLISMGLDGLEKSWWLGVGPGNVPGTIIREDPGVLKILGVPSLHNLWIDIIVTYGLFFGGIFTCIFFYVLLVNIYRGFFCGGERSLISQGVSLLLLSFVVGSMSPSAAIEMSWTYIILSVGVLAGFRGSNSKISVK